MDNIEFLQSLLNRGYAYESNGYILYDWIYGSCLFEKYPNPPPVQYPILNEECKRSKLDFPLFAPYTEGVSTPWGNGNMTANVAYIRDVLVD